ncbi:MAG: glycosyltransferase family 9 protein [Flavobacteriales bacterium]|nr:glycosyltransferase family 9 protein [Flavobacteriales bacterium]
MHILVIQTAFIGDAILASSVLEALNNIEKVSSISLMVRKGNESLYKGHPFLKRLHILDKSLPKFKQISGMVKEIKAIKYDVVINLQRFMTTGILTARSGAKVKVGFSKNPMAWTFDHQVPHEIGDGRHEVERNMDLLEPLFGKVYALPRLYPSKDDKNKAVWEGDYVCMAPSSVWFTKQWPEENWIELVKKIPSDKEVLLIGAPNDHELCEEIKNRSERGSITNLCGELSLLQSAALMQNADMNYVNDSAPLHLCSAVNAPVTSFFCSTIPAFGFGPLSTLSHIVETDRDLDCRPCGLHGKRSCPKGHFDCSKMNWEEIPIP